MPERSRTEFQISALAMQELRFERLEDESEREQLEVPAEFELTVGDPSGGALPIKLSVTLDRDPAFRISVTYGAIFHLADADTEDEDLEEKWRTVAAKLAPTVLYPYIRETVSTVMQKAGMPEVIAPVMDFGRLISLDDIVFPRPSGESEP